MTPAEDAIAVSGADKRAEYCALVSIGATGPVAARYVGLTDAEICRAADEDAEFRANLLRAQQKCEVRHLTHIHDAGEKHWQAAAWVLERLYPDRYARRGPEVITSDQIDYMLARLSDLVLEHVPESDRRDKFQAALGELAGELAQWRGAAAP